MEDARAGAARHADDIALVERCRAGDADAKRELLQRVLPSIRGAIRTLLGATADTDDAVQQAAIDVLRGLPTFRGDANLSSWSRTIAVRAGLKVARQNKRHLSVADPEILHAPAAASTPLTESIPRSVHAYLADLPDAQRQALVLRHGLGFTVPEIAELLDTSVNTIKSRLLHARREVRRSIRRDEAIKSTRGSS